MFEYLPQGVEKNGFRICAPNKGVGIFQREGHPHQWGCEGEAFRTFEQ